jgi:hypothetical protein
MRRIAFKRSWLILFAAHTRIVGASIHNDCHISNHNRADELPALANSALSFGLKGQDTSSPG